MNCIYCKTELTPQTRWVHIWPRAIGGRLKSREICCDTCNNTIGRVEDNLRESLSHTFASVGATTDEREPIAVAIEFNGHAFELAAGNAIMEVGGRRFDREKKQMIVPLPAGFDRQVELLAKAMHSHGLGPEAAMTLGLVPGDPEPDLPAGPVHHEHDLKLGGFVEHKRVFVKMALELLAYHRHDLATRGELSEARRFARHGTGTFRGRPDTRSEGSGLIHGVALPRVYNAIEVWSFGTVVFFRVVFIGPIVFTGTLTTDWSADAFRAAYAFDARDPSKSLVSDLFAGDGPNLACGSTEWSRRASKPCYRPQLKRLIRQVKGAAARGNPVYLAVSESLSKVSVAKLKQFFIKENVVVKDIILLPEDEIIAAGESLRTHLGIPQPKPPGPETRGKTSP